MARHLNTLTRPTRFGGHANPIFPPGGRLTAFADAVGLNRLSAKTMSLSTLKPNAERGLRTEIRGQPKSMSRPNPKPNLAQAVGE
jgi:hypothetical protein